MICCPTYYNIGKFSSCGNIDSGLLADITGIHRVQFTYKGIVHGVNILIEGIGEEIVIPNIFNEFSITDFEIIKPDASKYILNKFNCIYGICEAFTTFRIQTVPYLEHIIEEPEDPILGCHF